MLKESFYIRIQSLEGEGESAKDRGVGMANGHIRGIYSGLNHSLGKQTPVKTVG